MGSYMTVLKYKREYSDYPLLELKDYQEEQILISDNLLSHFASGRSDKLNEIQSWSAHSEIVFEVWKEIPEIYECGHYGKIKGVEGKLIDKLLETLTTMLEKEVSDIDKLISDGVHEVECLIGIINVVITAKNESHCLLFEWG